MNALKAWSGLALILLVAGGSLSCSFNPVEETYGKGVNQGLKAIENTKEIQDKVNDRSEQIEERTK